MARGRGGRLTSRLRIGRRKILPRSRRMTRSRLRLVNVSWWVVGGCGGQMVVMLGRWILKSITDNLLKDDVEKARIGLC